MAIKLSKLFEEARQSTRALIDYSENFFNPTVRLGVTGLSRAGKTVFITALVHGLSRGGRFPIFESMATGRIASARLEPQPDDAIPRFDYESHLRTLIEERNWPHSTVDISELRLVIDYQRRNGTDRSLTIDIVDYPGEWLLDLPLLHKSYEQWAAESLSLSRQDPRVRLAGEWHAHLATLDPNGRENEQTTLTAARLFTKYLRECRDEQFAMSLLPPGRFLMPGNLAGSPALTFAPLQVPLNGEPPEGSLWAMMRRRFEAYKDVVVRPFFREHFSRLDRQIVLVDALTAFNAGPEALNDLESAMAGILDIFRIGRSSLWSSLFRPKIDRILFAATKADHLHHSSHDRLESILHRLVERAASRAEFSGAKVDVVAMSAVRATREAQVQRGHERLPSIVGTPIAGETSGEEVFDGRTEVATFPGDLPSELADLFKAGTFRGLAAGNALDADYRFLRFRPPRLDSGIGEEIILPHIRLDRTLQFLIGDKLQ